MLDYMLLTGIPWKAKVDDKGRMPLSEVIMTVVDAHYKQYAAQGNCIFVHEAEYGACCYTPLIYVARAEELQLLERPPTDIQRLRHFSAERRNFDAQGRLVLPLWLRNASPLHVVPNGDHFELHVNR